MSPDSFQPEDSVGLETLQLFAKAERFNRWLYDAIAPYCKGDILEIGSGIGNISKFFLEKRNNQVSLSDFRADYCNILKLQFANNAHLNGVFQLNMSIPGFLDKYPQLLGQFDTVVALNLIEHIKDDKLAIQNCKKLLRQEGNLVILVPAFQCLYNSLDKELGHFKRYNKKKLSGLLINEEMKVVYNSYFNSVGIVGWWISGSVFKSKIISGRQLNFYNKLVPVFRLIDKLTFNIAGLSVVVVAKK
jgi:SAM-dependent methyltransferase